MSFADTIVVSCMIDIYFYLDPNKNMFYSLV